MHFSAKIPEISKQIVDELDSDHKEFDGVQLALAAYERRWLLQRMTDEFSSLQNKTKKSWKEEYLATR